MRDAFRAWAALGLVAVASGCSTGSAPETHGVVYEDSGAPSDTGATPDATAPGDSSSAADSGGDAASPGDTAPAVDAPAPSDTGTSDGASDGSDAPSDSPPDTSPPDAADSSPPADTSQAGDGSSCSSIIAVVGGNGTAAVGATLRGQTWTVSTLGGSAASTPAIVATTGGFQTVFREATTNALAYSTFDSSWSTLAPIGAALSLDIPALAVVGSDLHLIYRGTDSKFYHGTYAANAWDGAANPVSFGGVQSFGPSAPSAAAAGGDLVIAQDGSDNYLYDQTFTTAWQGAVQHAGAMVSAVAPTLVAANGGAYDLVVVYVHENDYELYWSGRASGTWSTPAQVGTNVYTNFPVSLAALPGGQLAMIYEGSNLEPYATLFNPAATPPWVAPAPLVASANPIGPSPPAVASGVCGYDAVAVFASDTALELVTLTAGVWSAPSSIPSTSAMTYAAIATGP